MAQLIIDPHAYSKLKGSVVVLTGGANGIGAATVELLYHHGAHVIFGDVDVSSAEKLLERLAAGNNVGTVDFVKCDITVYEDILNLFQVALEKHGHVDHAFSFAAVTEMGNWFDPSLTLETIREPPTRIVVDINLLGSLNFSHIAAVYLRQELRSGTDKSIIIMSSVAGFKETPGLYVYQATKHGVLGLMRSLRPVLPARGIRVCAILPWATDTIMTSGFSGAWKEAGLPINTPDHVAHVALTVASSPGLNGKSFYVEGGRAWEIEDNLDRLEPQWLGEEPAKSLAEGQKFLGEGADWKKNEKREL